MSARKPQDARKLDAAQLAGASEEISTTHMCAILVKSIDLQSLRLGNEETQKALASDIKRCQPDIVCLSDVRTQHSAATRDVSYEDSQHVITTCATAWSETQENDLDAVCSPNHL